MARLVTNSTQYMARLVTNSTQYTAKFVTNSTQYMARFVTKFILTISICLFSLLLFCTLYSAMYTTHMRVSVCTVHAVHHTCACVCVYSACCTVYTTHVRVSVCTVHAVQCCVMHLYFVILGTLCLSSVSSQPIEFQILSFYLSSDRKVFVWGVREVMNFSPSRLTPHGATLATAVLSQR